MAPSLAYLIRHGESTSNIATADLKSLYTPKALRALLDEDCPLTPFGEAQVWALARRLADRPIPHIFSSPFARAQQTAAILGTHWQVPVVTIEALHEVMPPLPLSPTEAHKPRTLRRFMVEVLWRFFQREATNGETFSGASQRVALAWAEIGQLVGPDESFAVVSHGAFLRVLAFHLRRHPEWKLLKTDYENAGLSVAQRLPGQQLGTTSARR